MQRIVSAKRKVNPYAVGKYALIAVGHLVLHFLTFLTWYMAFTFDGDPVDNLWWMGAVIMAMASAIVIIVTGNYLYNYLDIRSRQYDPYRD